MKAIYSWERKQETQEPQDGPNRSPHWKVLVSSKSDKHKGASRQRGEQTAGGWDRCHQSFHEHSLPVHGLVCSTGKGHAPQALSSFSGPVRLAQGRQTWKSVCFGVEWDQETPAKCSIYVEGLIWGLMIWYPLWCSMSRIVTELCLLRGKRSNQSEESMEMGITFRVLSKYGVSDNKSRERN